MFLRFRSYKLISNLSKISRSKWTVSLNNCEAIRFLHQATENVPVQKLYNNHLKRSDITSCLLEIDRELSNRGRITIFELQNVCKAIQSSDIPNSNQLLLLLRCCGSVAISVKPETRSQFMHKILSRAQDLGMNLDISHYNAILKVYLENEHKFSPSEFLESLSNKKVTPNRVTYQHLLTAYCQQGDLTGATGILEEMKKNLLPINEAVFNSLIMGHCFANDVYGAEGVLQIMKEKELEITSSTYTMLLCGYAMAGNMEKIKKILDSCEKEGIRITDKQLMDIIYYFALNGYNEYAIEILDLLEKGDTYNRTAIRLIFRLLHKNLYFMAVEVLSTLKSNSDISTGQSGRFIMRYLAKSASDQDIVRFSEYFQNKGFKLDAIANTLVYTLLDGSIEKSLNLLKAMQSLGQPIKNLYFWPLLALAAKENNDNQLIRLLKTMKDNYYLEPNAEIIKNVIFENYPSSNPKFLYVGLLNSGINKQNLSSAYIRYNLQKNNLEKVAEIAGTTMLPQDTEKYYDGLAACLWKTGDVTSFIRILYNWVLQKRILEAKTYMDLQEIEIMPEAEDKKEVSSEAIKEFLSEIMIAVNEKAIISEKKIMHQLLQNMIQKNLGITSKAASLIEDTFKDPEISSLLTKITEVIFDDTEVHKNLNSNLKEYILSSSLSPSEKTFLNFCRKNMLEDAENFFKDQPELQQERYYIALLKMINRVNKEEKALFYLKEYVEKFGNGEGKFSHTSFVAGELLKRGLTDIGLNLIKNISKVSISQKIFLKQILQPVCESDNLENINKIFNLLKSHDRPLFTLEEVLSLYIERYNFEKAIKLLENIDYPKGHETNLSASLLPDLYNNKNIEMMSNIVNILEQRFYPDDVYKDLVFYYSCTGNIKKGRALLRNISKETVLKLNNFSKILSNKERLEAIENAVKIIKDDPRFNRMELYENLIQYYLEEDESPSKGLELWTDMQEENMQPSECFLWTLSKLLKKSNVEVPFSVPEKYKDSPIFIDIPKSYQEQIQDLLIKKNYHKLREIIFSAAVNRTLSTEKIQEIIKYIQASVTSGERDIKFQQLEISLQRLVESFELTEHFKQGNIMEYLIKWDNKLKDSNYNSVSNRTVLPSRLLCKYLMREPEKSKVFFRKIKIGIINGVIWAHLCGNPKIENLANHFYSKIELHLMNPEYLKKLISVASSQGDAVTLQALINNNHFANDEDIKTSIIESLQKLRKNDLENDSSNLKESAEIVHSNKKENELSSTEERKIDISDSFSDLSDDLSAAQKAEGEKMKEVPLL